MSEFIVNTILSNVKKVGEGSNDKGSWELFKFNVSDPKFPTPCSYFHRGTSKKAVPFDGMKVKLLEVEQGDYKGKPQLSVKKYEPEESQPPPAGGSGVPSKAAPGPETLNVSFAVSYAKDVWIVLHESKSPLLLSDVIADIAKEGLMLKYWSEHPTALKKHLDSLKPGGKEKSE